MTAATALSETKRRLLDAILRGAGAAPQARDSIGPREAGGSVPLSSEQEQVWLHAAMTEMPLYNEAITIHRRGGFDFDALEASLNAVLARHEIWRTSFIERNGRAEQIVHPDLTIRLPLVDLRSMPTQEREPEALRLATQDAQRPFDLGQAPLIRAQVLRLADDDHRLALTLHHILFDGVSLYHILMPELATTYARLTGAGASMLPPVALHYADYAAWQAGHLAAAAADASLAFWRRELAGPLPVLELPTDRRRPALVTHTGGMEVFTLPPNAATGLKKLAAASSATVYMVLLAAFGVLLHRMSAQTDIVIGGVTDTRRHRESAGLMGYFLNTIALRTRPTPDLPFKVYLGQVRQTVCAALDAAEVPFERVVADLRPRRDPSRHPLFQVLFSVQPTTPAFPDGWNLTQMDVTVGTAKFDLTMELDDRPDGLIGRLIYNADLFDAVTASRIVRRYVTLLEAAAVDPACPIGDLAMIGAEEVHTLETEWPTTPVEPSNLTLHGWLGAQARRTPQAVAATFGTASWSYAELNARAERVAARMRSEGVGPDVLVGLCLPRSLELLAGLIGILKAGGAYLPLDATLPAARLRDLIDDAGAALLLTTAAVRLVLPDDATVILVEEADHPVDHPAPEAPEPAGPDDLAYVIYTSGSTGRPKGVEVSHRAVVNLLSAMQRTPGFEASDKLLAVTPLSFDIAALELLLPLVSGGSVILASRETATDPAALAGLIEGSACTVMQATPSTWRSLVGNGWPGSPGLKILCGGDVLPGSLADALLARSASVWNMYGPTETTIWSTLHCVEAGLDPVPIGRPIRNTTIRILDAQGRTVPIGVPGELHIGGAGVARGYRNQPALTRQRFAVHEQSRGQPLYRTGDRARFRSDGAIEWLGRLDDEVKIRGSRVALTDVEAALLRHPAVAAVAVKGWPDMSGETSLAAYLVPRDAMPDVTELRRSLRTSLPEHMIPSQIVPMTTLPTTPHGKLDRAALAKPEATPRRATPVAALDGAQQRLASLWGELLGVEKLAASDDFFELGGHSLLAAQLLRRIEDEFGPRVPMARLFGATTLEAMATLVTETGPRAPPQRTGQVGTPADKALMLAFESLGDDCEFGLVQRQFGAEPLGLLRFADLSTGQLVAALRSGFAGFDDPARLTVTFDARAGGGMVEQDRYGVRYPFFARPDLDLDRFRQEEAERLGFLARMLVETLGDGRKLLVAKSRRAGEANLVEALMEALAQYGPSTLLWVDLADADRLAGSVVPTGPRLLRGWVDRWTPPEDAQAISPAWLNVCRTANRLWQSEAPVAALAL